MKKSQNLAILSAAIVFAAAGASALVPVEKTLIKSKLNFAEKPKISAPAVNKPSDKAKSAKMFENTADFQTDFTVKGMEGTTTALWSENFNAGKPSDWKFEDGKLTKWEIKKQSGDKAFSAYDPTDAGSLYIEGDYRVYNRENAYAYTPELSIGNNASLSLFIGFSQNYDDYCRLYIAASTDDFNNEVIELYNTGQETGDRPWRWHPVSIDLDQFAGKTVKFRFTYGYGSGDEIFKTGGYFGDFTIDGISLNSATSIDKINVMTGEEITFVDLTEAGENATRLWTFAGGIPETSTEASPTVYYTLDGTYDVTLTVTDAQGKSSSVTKPSFVNVTGTEPTAVIGLPASFREYYSRLPLVAPLGEVVYTDASKGFPTQSSWSFSGINEDSSFITEHWGDSVAVQYHYMGQHTVDLEVSNIHGTSAAHEDITVAYDGLITNLRPDDYVDVFDLDGRGEFPGTNTMKITAYAEKFSKPSRPVMIEGAYVFFKDATAEELIDQISSIGVHLYTSENGLPGKRIDSWWWTVSDLNYDVSNGEVSVFPFTDLPIVDDEFFIVVDGVPEKSDNCTVSFYKSVFRGEGNSAYMLKDGEWRDISTYFPAGKNHASYAIIPSIYHSVMSNLPIGADKTVTFDRNGGIKDYEFFSYMGYDTPIQSSDDWLRVISEPNGLTVDTLKIQADPLPAGSLERSGSLTLTDGASTFTVPVVQNTTNDVAEKLTESQTKVEPTIVVDHFTVYAENGTLVTVHDMSGRLMYKSACNYNGQCVVDAKSWPGGIYIVKADNAQSIKIVKK